MPKISVIIPVYNVEKYIEQCVRSLFEQTLDDIEYIFIDDCSPDNSMDIMRTVLKEYPHRQDQVIEIIHSQNQGQAGARTSGMKAMTGNHMIHCDPDDWIELDMYETLYNAAIETDSDIVTCDFFIEDTYSAIFHTEAYASTHECLKQFKFTPHLWNKLIKTDIIRKFAIYPFAGINSGEDLNIIIRAYYHSDSIRHISKPLYHYNRTNISSITRSNLKQRIQNYSVPNINLIEDFFKKHSGNDFCILINRLKWRQKYELLEPKHRDIKLWSSLWPECHKDIHLFGLSKRQTLIFRLFANCNFIVWLYTKYIDWRTKQTHKI